MMTDTQIITGRKSILNCELGDWKPTHTTMEKISRALGVHPDEVREFVEVRRAEAQRMGLEEPLPFVSSRERAKADTAQARVS